MSHLSNYVRTAPGVKWINFNGESVPSYILTATGVRLPVGAKIACRHENAVEVTAGPYAERVAWLCLACDSQLDLARNVTRRGA